MLYTLPKEVQYDVRTALIKWWINSRKNGGMRLTIAGYNILTSMQYNAHCFNAKKLSTPNNLLAMDKFMDCPYYINGLGCAESKIFIFGNKEATIINLYGGFNEYLNAHV